MERAGVVGLIELGDRVRRIDDRPVTVCVPLLTPLSDQATDADAVPPVASVPSVCSPMDGAVDEEADDRTARTGVPMLRSWR